MADPILRYFERDIVTPGPGLTECNLLGKFQGFDPATGDAIFKAITPKIILNPVIGGDRPLAGTISGSLTTATNADLVVAYTDPGDRAPVHTWHWYRDGVEHGTTAEPDRTFSDTTVPNDSNAHLFFVRGESDDGLGDPSNLISLTFGGTTVVAPTALTGFARHNLTQAQVDLSWAVPPPPDTRVDKLGLFRQGQAPGVNAPLVDNLDPTALAFTLVFSTIGLGPGDRLTQLGVARHISTAGAPNNGWSPISNVITFNIPVAAVVHDPVMGATVNDEWTTAKSGRYPAMAGCRTYSRSTAISDLNLTNARVLGVTPDGNGSEGSARPSSTMAAQSHAAGLLADLEGFYYFSDGTPRSGNRNPVTGTEYAYATDNETDRGANPNALYFTCIQLCRDAIWTLNPGGGRRYPRARMGIDLTQNNIRNNGSGPMYKPAARYLDFVASSMYPPGRQGHTAEGTATDNIVWSSYAQYIDGVIAMVQDWMLTGGATGGPSPITSFATWEFGIPIDHPYRDSNSDGFSGEPTDLTNFTIRPRYLAGGIDSTGKDWTGFLQYLHDGLDGIGCIMREQLYWSQQSNPEIPNPFWHDQTGRAWDARPYPSPYQNQNGFGSTRANPDSETAWFGWIPGSRLARG